VPAISDPSTVGTLFTWLKADAGTWQLSTLTTPAVADGDPVGGWTDQTVNGHSPVQATATKRGTLKLNMRNGLPVIRFDGVTQFLSKNFTGVFPFTRFIAGYLRADPVINVKDTIVDGMSQCALIVAPGGGSYPYDTPFSNLYQGHSTMYPGVVLRDGWGVVAMNFQQGQAPGGLYMQWPVLRYNGVPLSTYYIWCGTNTPLGICIATYNAGTRCTALDVGEILEYNGLLSLTDTMAVEGYLRNRWATP
jgi:hypothetical protein